MSIIFDGMLYFANNKANVNPTGPAPTISTRSWIVSKLSLGKISLTSWFVAVLDNVVNDPIDDTVFVLILF